MIGRHAPLILLDCKAFKKAIVYEGTHRRDRLLGTVVLGNGLGGLRDGVLAQLSGEDEAHGSLHLLARDGAALVVGGQLAALMGDALKDVIDKAVHDGHGLLGDVDIGVALTEHLEDVAAVRLMARALATSLGGGGLLNGRLGGGLASGLLLSFGSHRCYTRLVWPPAVGPCPLYLPVGA